MDDFLKNALVINIGKQDKTVGECQKDEGSNVSKIKSNYAIHFGTGGGYRVVALPYYAKFNEIYEDAKKKFRIQDNSIKKLILTGNIDKIDNIDVKNNATPNDERFEEGFDKNSTINIKFIKDSADGEKKGSGVENIDFKIPTQKLFVITKGVVNGFSNLKTHYTKIEQIQTEVCNSGKLNQEVVSSDALKKTSGANNAGPNESESVPVADAESEPVAEPSAAAEPEPVAEPEPEVESEPVAEPSTAAEPEPVAEPEPEVAAELSESGSERGELESGSGSSEFEGGSRRRRRSRRGRGRKGLRRTKRGRGRSRRGRRSKRGRGRGRLYSRRRR